MLKKFTTRELIFIALMGALIFTVALSLGVGLIAVTGTPMMGGIIINLIVAYLLILAALIIRKFGTITLILLIHSTLSIPTINLGPPGAYKVLIAVSLGLIVDIILFTSSYKKWAYYIGAGFGFLVVVPFMWWMLTVLGLPGADKMAGFLLPLMGIYLVEALIGTWLAILTYNKKLKNNKLVKSFQD